ncbi:MAG: insulinase family protein [Planctomycetes bacterium]|nr:insulinase family protein [Planctomycetota bacterium]
MRFLLCLLPLCLAAPALAQDELPAHPREIAAPPLPPFHPPQPQTAELDGGARLLLIENHDLPLVDGRIVFRCGSIQDPVGKAGLAAVLADALRSGGSTGESGAELDDWLDAHAASIGIGASDDALTVQFSCLAEDASELLARVARLLLEPAYPASALENSRARLLTEIERRDDDTSELADRVLLQVIYGPISPYSRVETPESLSAITREDLLAYHAAHIGRDRMLIGVYGDVTARALELIDAEHFAALPQVGPAPEIPAPSFVQPQRTKVYVYDRPGVPQSELRIASPGTRRMHSSYGALNLWSYVIGIGGMTNRMMVKVRTELGLAYSVGAYYRPEWERSGRLEAFCSTRNDGLADAAEAMIAVLAGGLETIPTAELEATRARALNAEVFRVNTPEKVLERALLLAFHGYPADFYEQHELELRELTGDELTAAANRQLDADRLVVLAVGPFDEIAESLARIGEVERIQLVGDVLTPNKPGDATELLARMYGSIGGRERWAGLKWLDYDATVALPSGNQEVRVQRDLEAPRLRFTNKGETGEQTFIVNSSGAWIIAGEAVSQLPSDLHAKLMDAATYDLFALLHQIANGLEVAASVDGAIVVLDGPAVGARIELDVAGRPTRLVAASAEPISYLYQGWTEGDAFDAPARIVKEENGQTRVLVRISAPATLDEKLFEPPTGD